MKNRDSDIKTQKNAIRSRIRRQLLTLSDTSKDAFSKKITKYFLTSEILHTLKSLFVYISQPSEVSTCHLIKLALESEIKVYAPKIINHHMSAQRLVAVDDLIPGKWGILEPPASLCRPTHIDLVITPGLAFTKEGTRLGRGAGFYDQWLANNSYGQTTALAYDITLLDYLPLSHNDIQIDSIVTETRFINCRAERSDI
jgi:5-formyltetrahydrofolate cyclo-ligase